MYLFDLEAEHAGPLVSYCLSNSMLASSVLLYEILPTDVRTPCGHRRIEVCVTVFQALPLDPQEHVDAS